jgi:hypothetical protein
MALVAATCYAVPQWDRSSAEPPNQSEVSRGGSCLAPPLAPVVSRRDALPVPLARCGLFFGCWPVSAGACPGSARPTPPPMEKRRARRSRQKVAAITMRKASSSKKCVPRVWTRENPYRYQ